VVVDRVPQALERAIVVQDQTRGDAGGRGDLPQPDPVRPVLGEQPEGLVANDGPRRPVVRRSHVNDPSKLAGPDGPAADSLHSAMFGGTVGVEQMVSILIV
jgi:hypothetical protein